MTPNFSKKIEGFKTESGSFSFAYIPWDSEYLQNKTFEISEVRGDFNVAFNLFASEKDLKKCDLVFAKIVTGDVETQKIIQSAGFYCIEESAITTLTPDVISRLPDSQDTKLVSAAESDLDIVCDMSRDAFCMDRFHRDPAIPAERADFRTFSWIKNSFANPDEAVMLLQKDGETIGFFIYGVVDKEADLRLIALAADSRGKGYGKALYSQMATHLFSQGCETITASISLSNQPVLNMYSKLGAKFGHLQFVYHYTA